MNTDVKNKNSRWKLVIKYLLPKSEGMFKTKAGKDNERA